MIASYCKGLCYPLPIGYNQNPLIMPGGAPIVSKVALQLQSGFMVDNSTALHTHIYIYIYGSVSKPCTPGEHQNSW